MVLAFLQNHLQAQTQTKRKHAICLQLSAFQKHRTFSVTSTEQENVFINKGYDDMFRLLLAILKPIWYNKSSL